MDEKNIIISQYLSRYIRGVANDEEKKIIESWLEDDKNSLLYNKIKNKDALKSINEYYYNIEENKQKFFNIINNKTRNRYYKTINYNFISIASIVAVILIVPIIIFSTYRSSHTKEIAVNNDICIKIDNPTLITSLGKRITLNNDTKKLIVQNGIRVNISDNKIIYNVDDSLPVKMEYNTISVPDNGNYMFTMTDGTKVWLNAGCKFKFPMPFHKNRREVFLTGEAYFEVAKSETNPFIVNTTRGKVKVLGTKFNVKDDPDTPLETTLVEGKVEVSDEDNKVVLKPGQQSVFIGKEIKVNNVEPYEYVCWKDGYFLFVQKNIYEIINELSVWYGFECFYQNKVNKENKLRLKVKKYNNLSDILKMIEKAFDVKIILKDNNIIVRNK